MKTNAKISFLPASGALVNGETVERGQVVWTNDAGDPRSYPAVIVEWSKSGKTITLHRCTIRETKDGGQKIKLMDPANFSHVIETMRFRNGAFRNGDTKVYFSDED